MQFQYWFGWAILAAGAILFPASQAAAQEWEVGAVAGGSFYLDRTVRAASGASGQVGFQPGYVAGGFLAHNTAGRLSGEIRYLFENADMRLSSGGTKYTFGARAHLVHYDVVIHANSGEDRLRPFAAVGGGMKGYFGAGTERAVQPLNNLAILSRTSQWHPMVSIGAGIKYRISSRLMVRVEVRDYVTRIPKDVLLPSPGASLGGWLHNIMPLATISYILP